MATDLFLFTPGELEARKRKRKQIAIIAASVLLVIGFAILVTPHIRNAIRGWQSRRHAERSFAFADKQQWREARDEATAAYQLRPSEPLAMRAVARLLSRVGQSDALTFWKNLAAVAPLTRQDYRDEAEIALRTNDLAIANDAVEHLVRNVDGKPNANDFILAAEVAVRKRQFDKAEEFAGKVFADQKASKSDQLRANITLGEAYLNSGAASADDELKIDHRLIEISKGDDQVSLDALVALTQRYLSAQPKEKDSFPIPLEDLAKKGKISKE